MVNNAQPSQSSHILVNVEKTLATSNTAHFKFAHKMANCLVIMAGVCRVPACAPYLQQLIHV